MTRNCTTTNQLRYRRYWWERYNLVLAPQRSTGIIVCWSGSLKQGRQTTYLQFKSAVSLIRCSLYNVAFSVSELEMYWNVVGDMVNLSLIRLDKASCERVFWWWWKGMSWEGIREPLYTSRKEGKADEMEEKEWGIWEIWGLWGWRRHGNTAERSSH